ncbi:MAG: hypothetical protein M5R37_05090 [Melioribacteraceae bacterium]|nr:hypothetical protein [Melioribacteraceae bacterium]
MHKIVMAIKRKFTTKKITAYSVLILTILLILINLNSLVNILNSFLPNNDDIKPAYENEKLILIANFISNENNLNFDIRLKEAFNRAFWSSNVRIEILDSSLQSENINSMWHQGKIYNATIVIGGRVDKYGIKPMLFLPKISPGKYDNEEVQEDFYYKSEITNALAAVELGFVKNDVSENLKNHALPILTPQFEFSEIPSSEKLYNEIIIKDLPNSLIYLSKALLGIIAYLEKDFRTAEYLLDAAIKLTQNYLLWPLNIDNLFYYAGKTKLESKQYDLAEHYLNNALQLTRSKITRLRSYIYLSLIEHRKKNFEKSKTYCEIVFSESIEDGYYFTKSDRYSLYLYYARVCYDLGEYKLAEKYFSKLYEAKEDTSKSMFTELNFKIGLSNYFEERYEESKPYIYRAFKTDTTNSKFLYWMGMINGIFNNTDSCCYYLSKAYIAENDSVDRADVKNLMSKLGCD